MDAQSAKQAVVAIAERQDREAFAALFSYYAPRIKSYLVRGGASVGDADELAQEVMVTVWRKAALFRPERASASTWIFTIARNKRVDRFRRERRPEFDPDDPLLVKAEPVDAEVHRTRRAGSVRDALAELPEAQAAILEAAYFEGQSLAVVAERMGIPVGTVKSRVRLAFGRLRGSLEEETPP